MAWYADRISVWLPTQHEGFEKLDNIATELNTSSAGILITPSSYGMNNMLEISAKYRDFTSLVLDGQALIATAPVMSSLYDKDRKIETVIKRYPYRIPLLGYFMTFYGEKPVRTTDRPER